MSSHVARLTGVRPLATLIATAAIVVGACSSGAVPTGGTSAPTDASAAPSADVSAAPSGPATPDANITGKVTIWGWQGAFDGLQASDDAFKAAYPNITLDYVLKDSVMTDLQLAFAAGSGGPDVAVVQPTETQQLIDQGALVDVTDRVASYLDKMPAYFWSTLEQDGRYFGMPLATSPAALYYNREIWGRAGVNPEALKTWEDFFTAAQTIKEKTGAYALPIAQAQYDTWLGGPFITMLAQQGGGIFDADGNVVLDTDPRALATLQYLGRLWEAGLTADVFSESDPYYKGLADGTIASEMNGSFLVRFLKQLVPDGVGKWGVVQLPAWEEGGSRANNVGGQSLAITTQSAAQDAAWAYIEFHAGRTESQVAQMKVKNQYPALFSALDDPFFAETDSYFANQQVRAVFAAEIKALPEVAPYDKNFNQAVDLLGPEIQKFAIGQQSAEETLANAAAAIREALGQ